MIGNKCLDLKHPHSFEKIVKKTFCWKNKSTRKIKEFPKLSNKEIYFTLQSNNTKTLNANNTNYYDGVHLKTLPTLLEVILMHLFKACHEDGYDKINELSNFKCDLVSCFNKFKGIANELGPKITFLRTWISILNNNENLNI